MLQNTKKIHLILHLICEKSTESLIVQNIFKYKALEPNGSEGLWGGGASTAAMTDLGSCRLVNYTFWKLPLRKKPLGNYKHLNNIKHT